MALSARPTAKIRLGVDDTGVSQGLKNALNHWKEFATGINQSLEAVGKAYGLVSAVVGRFVGFVDLSIDMANEQARVEGRLATALQMRGEYTEEGLESLKAYAGELQKTTVIGDEVTLGLMSQLSALGVHRDQLKDAARATIGLAEAMGSPEGLNESAKKVAQVLQGNVGALKEVGIQATSTGDAMKQLTDLSVLAEQRASTFAGRVQQLANAWGDFRENLGYIVINSASIRKILELATGFIGDLGAFDKDKFTALFDTLVKQVVGLFGRAAVWIADVFDELDRRMVALDGKFKTLDRLAHPVDTALAAMRANAAQTYDQIDAMAIATMTVERWAAFSEADRAQIRERFAHQTKTLDAQLAAYKEANQGLTDSLRKLGQNLIAESQRPPGVTRDPVAVGGGSGGGDETRRTPRPPPDPIEGLSWQARDVLHQAGKEMGAIARDEELVAKALKSLAKAAAPTVTVLSKTSEEISTTTQMLAELGSMGVQAANAAAAAIGGTLAQAFTDLFTGASGEALAFNEVVGSLIMSIGQMLVQMGAAAVVMGGLAALSSAFGALLGVPNGAALAAAGGIAIGVGVPMIGIGAAMGGGARGNSAGAPTATPSVGPAGFGGYSPAFGTSTLDRRRGYGMEGAVQYVVNFNAPVADENAAARRFRDLVVRGERLQPAAGGWGR